MILATARKYAHNSGTVLLYSSGSSDCAKRSFLCINPSHTLTIYPEKWVLTTSEGKQEGFHLNPWDSIKEHLHFSHDKSKGDLPEWAGYLAYEMGAFSETLLPYYSPSIPLAQFFKYDQVIADPAVTALKTLTSLQYPFQAPENYTDLILKIQEEIRNGDVYQVNLSHELKWEFHDDPFSLFTDLTVNSPSGFAAYLKSDDFSLISSSPERLLRKKGQTLETRPIKGTMQRGKSQEEDQANAKKLMTSEKELAELLMITDLMRNDLGKVSLPGSVSVDPLMQLERYANVFHLVSIIRSKANPTLSPTELLRAVFPGGSVTGCPKLSAMQSIYKHEKRPRGIYTGSIGYFTSTGDFDFNIAIRTLLHQNGTLSCGLGGAIVSDSIPEDECMETLHKGASIFETIQSASTRYRSLN